MTAAFAERLAGIGFDATDLDARRSLLEMVLRAFEIRAGGHPESAWWVPGRLEVFGKHTDYAGGHSLVCGVPRGFLFVMRPRRDRQVRLLDARRDEEFAVDAERTAARDSAATPSTDPRHAGWRNYAHVVVHRLRGNFPGAALGADIVFASDLSSASGMSSSSALVTGLAAALSSRAGLHARDEWRANVSGPEDEASYYACVENGMSFGTLAGDAGVGTHGGSEDHAAIVCGRAGELTAWRFVPMQRVAGAPLPADWVFVVAATGVAARKTGDARESYNELSRRAGELLELWRRQVSPAASLGAALADGADACERLLALVGHTGEAEALERRLLHFRREDARVSAAVEAFRAGDVQRLGELAGGSQRDAESLLGNQVRETVHLARSARALGAMAASSFGAGFGGSVWALVRKADAGAFGHRWMADFRRRFPCRVAAAAFTMRPGPPLTRVV